MKKRTYQAPQVSVTELDIADMIMAASSKLTDLTPTEVTVTSVKQVDIDLGQ